MDVPSFGDGSDTVEKVKQTIPWLPDPYRCDCGAVCDAVTTYAPGQAMYVPAWECPECGDEYHRDTDM